jgi:hypothetical protein
MQNLTEFLRITILRVHCCMFSLTVTAAEIVGARSNDVLNTLSLQLSESENPFAGNLGTHA